MPKRVRNYQVRNFLRDDLQVGDAVSFYASNASAGAEEKGAGDLFANGHSASQKAPFAVEAIVFNSVLRH